MKRTILFLFTFALIGQLFCQEKDTLYGRILFAPNPCLDVPCLPGMVLAVENDTSIFILTIGGTWLLTDNPLVINNYTFENNDSVVIIGTIFLKKDIKLEKYYEIEIDSISFLTTSIEQLTTKSICVYPNPSNGMILINANDLNIKGIEVFDISGQKIYQSYKNPTTNIIVIEGLLNKGILILKILLDDNQVLTQKIIF